MSGRDEFEQAIEETGSTTVASVAVSAATVKQPARSFLQAARRDLSEDELGTPAVRRFLIAEIERLEGEKTELLLFSERAHSLQIENAVLKEASNRRRLARLLRSVCLSGGSVGIGAAPSYVPEHPVGWVILVVSAVFVVAGVIAEVRE